MTTETNSTNHIIPDDDARPADPTHATDDHHGEHMPEEHLQQIKDNWLETTAANIEPLIPVNDEENDFVWESHEKDRDENGNRFVVPLELEEVVDKHGKRRKRIVIAAAAAGLAGFGIAALMRGAIGPKKKK